MKLRILQVILAVIATALLVASVATANRNEVGTVGGNDYGYSSSNSSNDGYVGGSDNGQSDGYVGTTNRNYNVPRANARASVVINNYNQRPKVIYRTQIVRRSASAVRHHAHPAPKPVVIVKKIYYVKAPAKPVVSKKIKSSPVALAGGVSRMDSNIGLLALYGILAALVAIVAIVALALIGRRRRDRARREARVEREIVQDPNGRPLLNAPQGRLDAQTTGGVDFRSDAAFQSFLKSQDKTIEFQDPNATPPPAA